MQIYHIKAQAIATWQVEIEANSREDALEMVKDIIDSQDPVYDNKTYTITHTESHQTQQEAPGRTNEARALSDMREAWKKAQERNQ